MAGLELNPPLSDAQSAPTPEFFEKLKQLHRLGIELARLDDLDDLCRQAIVRGREELGIDRMGLFLISENRAQFNGTFGTDQLGMVRDERALIGKVANDPFMVELLDRNKRLVYRVEAPLLDFWTTVGYGWNAMCSLWDGDTLIGLLATDNLINHAPLTTMTLELVSLYSDTLAHLITRKRTEQALRDAEENNRLFVEGLRLLHEVTMELALVDDLTTLYQQAIVKGRSHLGFDRIGLFLFDSTTQELVGTFGTDEHGQLRDERDFRQDIREQPRIFEVLESRLFAKYWVDTSLHDTGKPIGRGWNAMAMLWDGDRCIGWLAADNLMRHDPLRPYMIELLTLYGATLGHLITRRRAEDARIELAVDHKKLQMLRTFVANISHDFKTPLAVLNTSLYLLEHTDDPVKHQQRIETMQRHIEYLNRLIQDLLMISRLEHMPALATVEINLNRLAEQAVTNLQIAFERKSLEADVRLDPAMPTIRAAQHELFRALVNLLENAINYTPEGGTISLHTRATPDSVYLKVSDTGIGISPEDLEHIFDHYYRADVANTYAQTGTGLGLAIVKRVIELHNGTISVVSEVGTGTAFEMMLPILIG